MTLPEIQMLWVGGRLSDMERLSIASYLRNGHPVRMFSYEDISNLPQGAQCADAREILPESALFANPAAVGKGGYTVFANFFRYHLLLQRGGIWSDCDVICLQPLDFAEGMDYAFATERLPADASGNSGVRVTNCFFKAARGAPVLARALELAQAQDLATAPWGSTGPRALNQAVSELGLTDHLLLPQVICPIDWWQFSNAVSGIFVLPENVYAVHLWNEMWRRNFFDKNAAYDPLCLYERLRTHYLIQAEDRHA